MLPSTSLEKLYASLGTSRAIVIFGPRAAQMRADMRLAHPELYAVLTGETEQERRVRRQAQHKHFKRVRRRLRRAMR